MQRLCGVDTMIPEWLANGDLPRGVHFAMWREIEARLSFNPRRQRLLEGLRRGCEELRKAGCRLIYLDGSFVTRKEYPGDFDACWDVQNVDENRLDPVFWDFSRGRAAQKQRFLGEFFPAQLPEGVTGRAFIDFFQVNKLTGESKGIVAIRLRASRRK
jgi:hypothetical protein